MTTNLVCAAGADYVMDYLEGAVPEGLRVRLEAHLASCPRCRAFVRSYLKTPAILRRATRRVPPRSLAASVLAYVRRPRD